MRLRVRPKIFLLGAAILLVVCLGIVSLLGFGLVHNLRQGSDFGTATSTSRVFLEYIRVGKIDSAYSMLSEKFEPRITKEQFSELIQQDDKIFATYERFDVCEWGLFADNGLVIDLRGLLYYGSGVIVSQISMHKDSDGMWRIQGFRLDSAANPKPYGLCK